MIRKILILLIIIILLSLFFFLYSVQQHENPERGLYSIYFMGEKVGYEEYTWQPNGGGFLLSVKGRLTKPSVLVIDDLSIRVDKSFIPVQFDLKGSVSGMLQEISSTITEGQVESTMHIGDQEQKSTAEIRRDAFLLPNPIFSPYMVLTKKYRCSLQEAIELSAYIIPQLEMPFTLEPKEEKPCSLVMRFDGIQIELETDERGTLKALHIPSQKLKVIKTSS